VSIRWKNFFIGFALLLFGGVSVSVHGEEKTLELGRADKSGGGRVQ
jgi:hypothetical protein